MILQNYQKNLAALLIVFCIIFLISSTGSSSSAGPGSNREINLKLGETHLLNGTGKIWLEKSNILQITEAHGGYLLKGVSPGSTLVKIGEQTTEFFVLNPAQERSIQILNKRLPKTLGLKMNIQSGKVKILGQLLMWQDWYKIFQDCEASNCDYQFAAKINSEMQKKLKINIDQIFKQRGLAPQAIIFDQEVKALTSEKGDIAQKTIAALKAFGIKTIISSQNVDVEPLIKVQITVAEIKRDAFLKYGVDWATSYQAQILPKFSTEDSYAEINLQALEQSGLGKVLASPNILCKSGKEADFFAGGEFPIKIINMKIQEVIWKKYGIMMKIQPKADYSGKMSISIETEVSSLDTSHTVDGIPGLFTNKIQSHFDLSESRTIALSGLIKSEQGEASSGLPGLSHIPVLGSLFSSRDFRENRTELVVFVRPEVVSPGSLEATP